MNPSFLFFIPISLNYFLVIVKLCAQIVMLKRLGKRVSGKYESIKTRTNYGKSFYQIDFITIKL